MTNKQTAKEKIESLVTRFEEQYASYKNSDYNETLTRRDFIDPFFKSLGWDIDNECGYAEAYREVIHEDKVKVSGSIKAPDYSFKLVGGKRLFFVEAKKPSISVKEDIQPAYQVRRYGWSAKLPISIITDFEEFSIYDCTKKPKPTDKPPVSRIKYLSFRDYIKEFDFIWDTFSKEQVLKGSFDKFIISDAQKKGTASVDKDFLESLDRWRTYLAVNISWNNKTLDEDEINFVVQQTIDRIIFLRIAEDRSVEPYGTLQHATKAGNLYRNLFEIFQKADEKYNSGLFDFKKDKISQNVVIENKIIKTIINELYYPECPYEFSVLPVEILGSAYEQFLGKVIRITPAHHAKIEEKPEVRKAGGVYYTPQYIVDYIVKNTIGRLIEGKTPKEISKIKILDPACGSGSFLIGAFQYLLDFHKRFYSENGKLLKGKKDNPLTPDGHLTTAEKKRILLNNIYGVDLDTNAVEVTKLSLLLKCLEGETEASIKQQLLIWNERVLPSLEDNIKCGNSLIDTDFYESEIDFGEEKKIKPFNWANGFLNIPSDEGFDVVIGNPPYGASFQNSESNYYKEKYKTAVWRGESYLLFIEKSINLLKINGLLGFIIPDTLLNLGFTKSSRDYILSNSKLQEVVLLPSNVFYDVTVDTIILLTEKKKYTPTYHPSNVTVRTFQKKINITNISNPEKDFKIGTDVWYIQKSFNLQSTLDETNILLKLETNRRKIKQIADMYSGIKVYEVGKGNPPQTEKIREEKPFTSITKKSNDWEPFYDGKHIGRYQTNWDNNNWIFYGKWLAAPRDADNFKGEKILIRKITSRTLLATYVKDTSYCNTLLFIFKIKDQSIPYLATLGILNSKLIGWYFRKKFQINESDTFPQIMMRDILEFPFPDFSNNKGQELSKYVEIILDINSEVKKTTLQAKKDILYSKLAFYEQQVNNLVYSLYDLSSKEIVKIEQS